MKEGLQELFDIINYPEENCSEFTQLCEKAKLLIFDALIYGLKDEDRQEFIDLLRMYEILGDEMTPVEQIFWVSYWIYSVNLKEYHNVNENFDEILPVPINLLFIEEITPQKEIIINGRKIKPDFVIDFSRKNIKNEYIYPIFKDLKYVIEIDGFEYHSKKQQLNYDYERENLLKLNGYNVIRFTGSQVYRKPYNCVNDLITIVLKDMSQKVGEYNGRKR